MIKEFLCIFCFLILLIILIRFLYRNIRKKTEIASSDITFIKNTWNNNYMLGAIEFKDKKLNKEIYLNEVKKRIDEWEINTSWYKEFKIKGLFEINDKLKEKQFFKLLYNTNPPLINGHLLPFKIFFLKKENKIFMLLNHYYCDGLILHDMIMKIFANSNDNIKFFKYKYIPIFSDILLLKYGIKQIYKLFIKKNIPLQLNNKSSTIITKEFKYEDKINRWTSYALNISTLFKYIDKNMIRVGFTVGFDDVTTYSNNRIGLIILDVPKLNSIDEYILFFKKEIIKNKYDAMVSYDLIRNFPLHILRKKLDNKIDVIFTSFKLNADDRNEKHVYWNKMNYYLGSFVGIGRIPIYLLSITADYEKTIKTTIKTTTSDFDHKSFLKNEPYSKKIYTFKSNHKSLHL